METLLSEFLATLRLTYAPESIRAFRWNLSAFWKYLSMKKLDIYAVKKDDIERFLLETESKQLRCRRLLLIRRLYEYVKKQRPDLFLLYENPAAGIQLRSWEKRQPPKVPGRATIETFCNSLKKTSPRTFLRNRLMLELAYGSGLRRSELAALCCEDMDYTNKTAQVTGKGNKTRVVPLTKVAIDLLQEYLAYRKCTRGPVLVSKITGKRLVPSGVSCIFTHNIGIRPHLLRHACATHMLQNGCNVRVLQELLGHKSIAVTQLYTAVNRQDLAKVIAGKHPRGKGEGRK